MNAPTEVTVTDDNHSYTFVVKEDGALFCRMDGRPWLHKEDLVGTVAVKALVWEVQVLRKQLDAAMRAYSIQSAQLQALREGQTPEASTGPLNGHCTECGQFIEHGSVHAPPDGGPCLGAPLKEVP